MEVCPKCGHDWKLHNIHNYDPPEGCRFVIDPDGGTCGPPIWCDCRELKQQNESEE
jgi:hypothetical protein